MTYKTHATGGILLAGLVGAVAGLSLTEITATATIGGIAALTPDLDMPNSKASRYGLNRLIAYPLNKLFGHRGFIHSPILGIVLTILLALAKTPTWVWTGFGLGFLSHLMLDTLNPTGIPWLWPMKKKFHIANIKTNTGWEYAVLAILSVAVVGLFFVLVQKTI